MERIMGNKAMRLVIMMLLVAKVAVAARFEATVGKEIIQNVSGTTHCMLNKGNDTLEFGKKFDDLLMSESGVLGVFTCSFHIRDIKDVHSFILQNVSYKDYALVNINGQFVWSSHGQKALAIDYSKKFEDKFYGVSMWSQIISVETKVWHDNTPHVNVQGLLRQGNNAIEVVLVAGQSGGFSSSWKLSQRADKEYKCVDGYKTCISSDERIVEGVKVNMPCWQYSYIKTCDYPSKNDCGQFAHCYFMGQVGCLLYDKYGNCVNQKHEYSCKKWQPTTVESQKVRVGLESKDGEDTLVCGGIQCIDGNCFDKSYETNGEMMDSVAKLYAVSKTNGAKGLNSEIFAGFASHCSKKATNYTNCCGVNLSGWGRHLGAGCTTEEKALLDNRRKKLCVYVGKQNKGMMNAIVKHYWCCFGNMLNKTIQVEDRKHLGLSWGEVHRTVEA